MSIKLAVAGRPPIVIEDEYITLGNGPGCSVTFPETPDVKSKHAIIHLVAGRWLLEAREADSVFVGSNDPKRTHWLNQGDVIRLSEDCPPITFHLANEERSPVTEDAPLIIAETQPPVKEKRRPASDVVLAPDSDPIIPTTKPALASKPPASATQKTTKQPSSAIIQIPKSPSSSNTEVPKAPSSTEIKSPKAPSSTTIPTKQPPSSTTIPTRRPPSSTTIPTKQPPSSTMIPTKQPLSSTGIPTKQPPSSMSIKTTKSASSDSIPARKGRSEGQVPAQSNDSDEPTAKVPVLKRMSSWEAPIVEANDKDAEDDWEGGSKPRGRKRGDDADMKFIKMVVIRFIVSVVGLVILWHGYKEVRKALSAPKYTPTSMIVSPSRNSVS